ncbi:MAG: hypothetical protein GX358_04120 [candidate division WS1 bacterium]|jgi:putative Mg2+ transporter-C (MgtC) family protein|nr:hypothetical protein [candidate division WS1 bacterium]
MDLAPDAYGTLILRLVVAFVLGGLMGLEREWHHRPAGLRTHILVCVASALFGIISAAAVTGVSIGEGDPSRVAASVVSGIGFLGAGTIMRYGNVVRGLTTAASLWMVAAIGLSCGVGWYAPAVFTTVIGILTLAVVDWFAQVVMSRSGVVQLELVTRDNPETLPAILETIRQHGANISSVKFDPCKPGQLRRMSVRIQMADSMLLEPMCQHLEVLEDVKEVLVS